MLKAHPEKKKEKIRHVHPSYLIIEFLSWVVSEGHSVPNGPNKLTTIGTEIVFSLFLPRVSSKAHLLV